jgi:hypothetical protein
LTSLLLLNGVPPVPLSPVLLHYFIHNLDLNSISPDLLRNWYPVLGKLIEDWIATGPNGDIEEFSSHFITFHDIQVSHYTHFIHFTFILFLVQISSLASRDEATHHLLACEMLYRAIVGPAQPDHSDIQVFLRGFQLPCRNGFRFTDVSVTLSCVILPPLYTSSQFIKRVEGGSEMLLSILWTSNISSPNDFIPYLNIRSSSSDVARQLAAVVPDTSIMFSFIIKQFLQGTGVPCPGLFEEAKVHFIANLVDLSNIGLPSFRSKIFSWATTGSVSINTNEDIRVSDSTISLLLLSGN